MSKTLEFLNSLTDRELAYFSKFKLHKYSKYTQDDIKEFLKIKNFSEEKINSLIPSGRYAENNQTKQCPQCGSKKLLINNVQWTETYGKIGWEDDKAVAKGFSGKITYKDEVICNVCDYWLQDPNGRGPNAGKKLRGWSFWNLLDWILK